MSKFHFDYQPDVDLLFAWVGDPRVAEDVEVAPGIHVRVTQRSHKPISVEILDCASRFDLDPHEIGERTARGLFNRFAAASTR